MSDLDVEVRRSASWDRTDPTIAVVVSTFRRAAFLPELVAAIEAQDLDRRELELVAVDNGSGDDTWSVLVDLVERTPLAMAAVRLPHNRGPAPGRNAGVAHTRAPLVAVTDDDCLPTPGWLRGMRRAFEGGADVVQGSVRADPVGLPAMGPWDHTIGVTPPTPFFETCNVAYRRTAFDRAGGFDEDDPLLHPPSGRAFGEDACLAWEIQRTGGEPAFAPEALVHHRCLPGTYERWLADQRQLSRFPGLARRSPLVARWLFLGVFLSPRSALFDLGLVGTVTAAVLWSPW
ncbi:MAG TPA: glycosyltransferase family 2 protein, partial [Acidimicrobiales bacterium]|nr:glycosyltransferase family 2 protein [Acidimicrobiales bacterium]